MKCLIYVTRSKPYSFDFYRDIHKSVYVTSNLENFKDKDYILNGKIVAEFDGEVKEIKGFYDELCRTYTFENEKELLKKSCLDVEELGDYLKIYYNNDFNKVGYAIHINNLKVFEKPKELSDFYTYDNSYDNMFGWAFEDREKFIPLKRAPQNMMKVYDKDRNEFILISIRPEWACKILNGEKTIEVRKQVLNCMKGKDY